ncbi:MAG: hypothetical protein JNM78_11040 [Cyclobacteriaceae bacterium]|nr:hypothetical protein [Cyclobacteriaceae bacterium]
MMLRRFILGLALLAYSASLAHSILPHSHYNSHQESREHHEHESKHHHDESNGDLAFPVHNSNTDVELSKSSTDHVFKNQANLHFVLADEVILPSEWFLCEAYHVPIDLRTPDHPKLSSCSLRAPPLVS